MNVRGWKVDAEGLCINRDAGEDPDTGQVALAKYYLTSFFSPTNRWFKERGSYGLKHDVENWLEYHGYWEDTRKNTYVSNGALIVAALELGFEMKNRDNLNAEFKICFKGRQERLASLRDYHGSRADVPGVPRQVPPEIL